ncbi:MAG: hypothetical protein SFV32_02405 [Opitutaceae bacterium]|nr:hypothetical protein [Opitutaceae bacterium]
MMTKTGFLMLVFLLTLAGVASVAWVFVFNRASALQDQVSHAERRVSALRRHIESKGGMELEDKARRRWEEVEAFRSKLLTTAAAEDFIEKLKQLGSVRELGSVDLGEYTRRRLLVSRGSEPMSVWLPVVESVKAIQSVPGVSLRSFRAHASGTQGNRVFQGIEIEVAIAVENLRSAGGEP